MSSVVIDARGMLPPEPLARTLAALDLLGSDDELTLLVNRRPYLLFMALSSNGYKWNEAEEEAGGGFRYRIFKIS